MTMGSNVKASTKTSSGSVLGVRARVRGIYWVSSGTAGSIRVKDGGSSGTTLIDIATPASATSTGYVLLPDRGVLFNTDCYLTITDATSVTVFYEG